MGRDLPTGTVTFLFTDVEGSTRLLHRLGAEAYSRLLTEHRTIMRDSFRSNGGVEVDTQGDAFFVVFPDAPRAVAAARDAVARLAAGPIRVRMGLHTGTPHLSGEGYVGEDVHLGARIASAGHGGQVLLSAATRSLVDGDITELGEHRLKDFAQAVPIFQLGSERFPPLKTIANTNLPRPASNFVGRERELAEIVSLVRGGARLVTLSGPGGTGKTRLAIEASSELVGEFKAGVFWVDLSPLRDPALVTGTISRVLGAKDGLAAHIADRDMLLLLDNLEQIIDAAAHLGQVLEACPNLRLLVTSRALLRLRGEVEYAVPPLSEREAVELFCGRANVRADVSVVAICDRLDRLPLAIELAAARARVLSPEQIAERLERRLPLLTSAARDLPERQRTLRAAIAWSYELLAAREQHLFARLAVFRGSWTLDAAERVARGDIDSIQSLVESSLIRRDGGRFVMLETIREYATERLDASDETDELRLRHAEHYVALVEAHERVISSGDPAASLDLLEREIDNLRAAIDSLEASGDAERAMGLAGSLVELWCQRGHAVEGWRRAEALLDAHGRATPGRGRALTASVHLGPAAGAEPGATRRRAEEAIELNSQVGQDWDVAHAVHQLGAWFVENGEPASAVPLLEESIERYRRVGYVHGELVATRALAWAHLELGDRPRYRAMHEELIRRARSDGDKIMQVFSLGALGWVATQDERYADALALLEESYPIVRENGDPAGIGLLFTRLALLFASWGLCQRAAILLARAEVIREESGESDAEWIAEQKRTADSLVRAALDQATLAAAIGRGRAITNDEAATVAFAPHEGAAT